MTLTHDKLIEFIRILREDGYTTGKSISKLDLIKQIKRYWGYSKYIVNDRIDALVEADLLKENINEYGVIFYTMLPIKNKKSNGGKNEKK